MAIGGKIASCRPKIELTVSRSLQISDANCHLFYQGSAPLTLIIPASLPPSIEVEIAQLGSGVITVVPDSQVQINRNTGAINLVPNSSVIFVFYSATDIFAFGGEPPIIPIEKGGTGALSASEALTNLGGTSLTTFNAHSSNTQNPHNVTPSQVGNTVAQWNASHLQGKTIDIPVTDATFPQYDQAQNRITWISLPAAVPSDNSITNSKVAPDAAIDWSKINKATAIASDVNAAPAIHGHPWTVITDTPTTLAGYNITDAQEKNTRLTEVSNISPDINTVVIGDGTKLIARSLNISDIQNLQIELGQKALLTDLNTTAVSEGTQLYHTTERVRTALSAANGVIYNSNTGVFSIDSNFVNRLIENYFTPTVSTFSLGIENNFLFSIEGGQTLLLG